MNFTMSCVDVPGRKIPAIPAFFRPGMSASGMIPPSSTVTSSMPFSCSKLMSCGQSVLCAPERIESPMTSTSSCTAAEAIISEEHGDVVHALFVQQAHELRAKRVVRAGKDRKPDDVDVFLHGRRGNHLRGLAQTGIDHFHTRIAQCSRNDLGAAVMPVQPRLRNQNPYLF